MCGEIVSRQSRRIFWIAALAVGLGVGIWGGVRTSALARPPEARLQPPSGQEIFRYDTFGDEEFWTRTLRMHEVIQAAVDPLTALSVGLKVDVDALPTTVKTALQAGDIDLTDPATTLTLLELNAVIGVIGEVETVKGVKTLKKVGISCALCHSTVDDSFAAGIGHRLDGWPNRDLNPGAIIALSPALSNEVKAVYNSWGPGKYDPRFNIDGLSTPAVIPPAYGLAGINMATYTADGDITYWNRYVAVMQMGGHGIFIDPRIPLVEVNVPDQVQRKLKALREYQLSLVSPPPPANSYDADLAAAGEALFNGSARCAECHLPGKYTDVNEGVLHAAKGVGQDPEYAERSVTKKYRTTPLRGLWQHAPYFHDGSAATLDDVVSHYDVLLNLQLNESDRAALVEFLKTL